MKIICRSLYCVCVCVYLLGRPRPLGWCNRRWCWWKEEEVHEEEELFTIIAFSSSPPLPPPPLSSSADLDLLFLSLNVSSLLYVKSNLNYDHYNQGKLLSLSLFALFFVYMGICSHAHKHQSRPQIQAPPTSPAHWLSSHVYLELSWRLSPVSCLLPSSSSLLSPSRPL